MRTSESNLLSSGPRVESHSTLEEEEEKEKEEEEDMRLSLVDMRHHQSSVTHY